MRQREWPTLTRAHLWRIATQLHGPESPQARTAFGRYVASRGGVLTHGAAGEVAWTAWLRYQWPGTLNRAHRRWMSRSHSQAA